MRFDEVNLQVFKYLITIWLFKIAMERSTIFKNGKPSISMGHGFHGYVSHNQRVNHLKNPMTFENLMPHVPMPVPTGTISPKPTDVKAMTTSGGSAAYGAARGGAPGNQAKMVILGELYMDLTYRKWWCMDKNGCFHDKNSDEFIVTIGDLRNRNWTYSRVNEEN